MTVTALDQFGKPIAGVNFSSDKLLGPNLFFPIGTTNVDGIVDTSGAPGLQLPTQSVNDGTIQYVGNVATGDQSAYDPALGDIVNARRRWVRRSPVTWWALRPMVLRSTSMSRTATTSRFRSSTRTATTSTSATRPRRQQLTYHWTKTPFFFDETIVGDSHTLGAEVNGLYDIPVLTGADFDFGLEPGTYKLFASLSEGGTGHPVAQKQVLTVKVGDASVRAESVIVPVGTTASVPAQLVLEDGTPLPGRKVNVTYNLGVEYNEHGIPTGTPDAVLVSNTPDTTDGSGNFTPMVEDLSTDPNEPELGGDLVVQLGCFDVR